VGKCSVLACVSFGVSEFNFFEKEGKKGQRTGKQTVSRMLFG